MCENEVDMKPTKNQLAWKTFQETLRELIEKRKRIFLRENSKLDSEQSKKLRTKLHLHENEN